MGERQYIVYCACENDRAGDLNLVSYKEIIQELPCYIDQVDNLDIDETIRLEDDVYFTAIKRLEDIQ